MEEKEKKRIQKPFEDSKSQQLSHKDNVASAALQRDSQVNFELAGQVLEVYIRRLSMAARNWVLTSLPAESQLLRIKLLYCHFWYFSG